MCMGYFTALVQTNIYTSHFFKKRLWCNDSVSYCQAYAVVLKFAEKNPEVLHTPFINTALRALGEAFPCDK